MENITKINDSLSVKEAHRKNRTIISVIDGEKELLLSDIETDDYFWSEWVYDENYVVAYSRGCMVNQLPLTVEAAYSIKNKRLLNMNDKKIRELLEFMLICKKGFDLTQILTEINGNELGLLSEEEKQYLRNYLTSGNKNIDKKTIIDYILESYPSLKRYTSLKEKLSVSEYHLIEEELGDSTFWLHAIPQDLAFVETTQEKKLKK